MTNGHRRIFAGTELAARIERAERSLIAESALAAGRRDPGGRCFATTLAGGVAAWAGEGSPLNKVAGLGSTLAIGLRGFSSCGRLTPSKGFLSSNRWAFRTFTVTAHRSIE